MSDDRDEDYEVGYRKPPKGTRFKKGQSGNPNGRRKKTKTISSEVADILNEPIAITKGRRTQKIPAFEASVRKLIQRAIKNKDLAAIMEFVELCERHGIMKVPKVDEGCGVIVAPPGVDFQAWFEANTEVVPVYPDCDEDE